MFSGFHIWRFRLHLSQIASGDLTGWRMILDLHATPDDEFSDMDALLLLSWAAGARDRLE